MTPIISLAFTKVHLRATSQQLMEQKALAVQNLDAYMVILEDLEELGEIMGNMLEQQRKLEVRLHLCVSAVILLTEHVRRFASSNFRTSSLSLISTSRRSRCSTSSIRRTEPRTVTCSSR